MNRYPEYKDSGVEWIGEVPSHWGIKKIKYVLEEEDIVVLVYLYPKKMKYILI